MNDTSMSRRRCISTIAAFGGYLTFAGCATTEAVGVVARRPSAPIKEMDLLYVESEVRTGGIDGKRVTELEELGVYAWGPIVADQVAPIWTANGLVGTGRSVPSGSNVNALAVQRPTLVVKLASARVTTQGFVKTVNVLFSVSVIEPRAGKMETLWTGSATAPLGHDPLLGVLSKSNADAAAATRLLVDVLKALNKQELLALSAREVVAPKRQS